MYHGVASNNVEGFTPDIEDYTQWYYTARIRQRLKGLAQMHYRNQALKPLTT
ncbi:IS3 family transposase [Corynebacterium tuberculostearicum]|uniref:IS3 family transposase n=1 Tax=Corynebacterium TaxID=1716 RepID=UPI001EF3A46B|nr:MULTISPECIES: IS3 family transposase [Corynebacterium]MCG7465316.1 integrase core domain-containing protein [Corynebacterium sp. ACRPJ]